MHMHLILKECKHDLRYLMIYSYYVLSSIPKLYRGNYSMTDKLLRHIFELCSHDYYILFWLQVPHHTLHHCMEVEVVAFIWMVFHAVEMSKH